MASLRPKNHSYIAWDGYSKNRKAKCVTCGIIMENTGKKKIYWLDGKNIPNPGCTINYKVYHDKT